MASLSVPRPSPMLRVANLASDCARASRSACACMASVRAQSADAQKRNSTPGSQNDDRALPGSPSSAGAGSASAGMRARAWCCVTFPTSSTQPVSTRLRWSCKFWRGWGSRAGARDDARMSGARRDASGSARRVGLVAEAAGVLGEGRNTRSVLGASPRLPNTQDDANAGGGHTSACPSLSPFLPHLTLSTPASARR
ncbi:hypothetical protein C8R47DRAFT_98219 [Mycena vitilis]|nr:hypothetical protein C8R47DRAFT_98219 [Mycena vitilis]